MKRKNFIWFKELIFSNIFSFAKIYEVIVYNSRPSVESLILKILKL